MNDSRDNSMADHDLIIRLDTKMDLLTKTVGQLKDDTVGRIVRIESDKLDRADFEDFKLDLSKNMAEAIGSEARAREALASTLKDYQKDHEARMRNLERIVWIASAVVILLNIFVIPYLPHFFSIAK